MNREIKFRGWIRCQNKMIGPMDMSAIVATCSTPLGWADWMQYTGLKDKNGAEIYEGDIAMVTIRGGSPHFVTHQATIEFSDYLKCLVAHLLGENIDDSEPVGKAWEYEVIGNIHENPELMGAV